jgi:hypothetical protein
MNLNGCYSAFFIFGAFDAFPVNLTLSEVPKIGCFWLIYSIVYGF